MEKEFENWVTERENELFEKEKFVSMGKGDDYNFQALAFVGKGSQQLSLATTVLRKLDEVPVELKEELKSIQHQLSNFSEKLRKY